MVKIMENLIKMDDLGAHPYFWFNTQIFHLAHELRLDRRPICMLRSYYRGTLAQQQANVGEDVGVTYRRHLNTWNCEV